MMYDHKGGQSGIKDVNIGLLQIHSRMKDTGGNLKEIRERVREVAEKKANLIIAPELALNGELFKMEDWESAAQTIPGSATEEIGAAAKKANAYVIFGMVERSGSDLYNSAAVLSPQGNLVARYRKTHLWSFENKIFKHGEDPCFFDTEFGRVGVTICYDACFPEFIRALAAMGCQVIAHATFWLSNEAFNAFGDKAAIHLNFCCTRAFENQVYFASANRVGNDEHLYGLGNSLVATPWGSIAGRLYNTPGTLVVRTDWARIPTWQGLEPLWVDRRPDFYRRIMDFSS
jgi:predicted amidohydrolase